MLEIIYNPLFLSFTLLLVIVVSFFYMQNIIFIILLASFLSLLVSLIFTMLDAVDVAITEAAIGGTISTALTLIIVYLTKSFSISQNNFVTRYKTSKLKKIGYFILLASLFLIFLESVLYLPIFGNMNNPANNILYKTYILESYNTFKVQNIVTMILGSFRGYDTLGETAVIFIAALSVYAILNTVNFPLKTKQNLEQVKNEANLDFISKKAILSLIPFIFLYAFYVQFHGDYGPGGGFQAGVIAAAPFILLNLFYSSQYTEQIITSEKLIKILGLGLFLYTGCGILTMALGGYFLDYFTLGKNINSSYHYGLFIIELGVGITVFAAMAIIIQEFYKKIA